MVKVFTELHRVSPSRTSGTGQYIGMTEALRVHLEFDKRFNALIYYHYTSGEFGLNITSTIISILAIISRTIYCAAKFAIITDHTF